MTSRGIWWGWAHPCMCFDECTFFFCSDFIRVFFIWMILVLFLSVFLFTKWYVRIWFCNYYETLVYYCDWLKVHFLIWELLLVFTTTSLLWRIFWYWFVISHFLQLWWQLLVFSHQLLFFHLDFPYWYKSCLICPFREANLMSYSCSIKNCLSLYLWTICLYHRHHYCSSHMLVLSVKIKSFADLSH